MIDLELLKRALDSSPEPVITLDVADVRELLLQATNAESLWLNAFSCIRPTDTFAAEVGRAVINMVMQHPGRQVVVRVRAS